MKSSSSRSTRYSRLPRCRRCGARARSRGETGRPAASACAASVVPGGGRRLEQPGEMRQVRRADRRAEGLDAGGGRGVPRAARRQWRRRRPPRLPAPRSSGSSSGWFAATRSSAIAVVQQHVAESVLVRRVAGLGEPRDERRAEVRRPRGRRHGARRARASRASTPRGTACPGGAGAPYSGPDRVIRDPRRSRARPGAVEPGAHAPEVGLDGRVAHVQFAAASRRRRGRRWRR